MEYLDHSHVKCENSWVKVNEHKLEGNVVESTWIFPVEPMGMVMRVVRESLPDVEGDPRTFIHDSMVYIPQAVLGKAVKDSFGVKEEVQKILSIMAAQSGSKIMPVSGMPMGIPFPGGPPK